MDRPSGKVVTLQLGLGFLGLFAFMFFMDWDMSTRIDELSQRLNHRIAIGECEQESCDEYIMSDTCNAIRGGAPIGFVQTAAALERLPAKGRVPPTCKAKKATLVPFRIEPPRP